MIERVTVVDQVEVRPDGIVQVRLAKLLVENGVVIGRAWHRTVIEPGTPVDAQMGEVNRHLVEMGESAVADYKLLREHVALAHTPERVAAFRAAKAMREKQARGGKP